MIIHIEVDDASGQVMATVDGEPVGEGGGQFDSLPDALEAVEVAVEGSWEDEGDLEADMMAGYDRVAGNKMAGSGMEFGEDEPSY